MGFIAGKFDSTFIPVSQTVQLLKDIQNQMPQAAWCAFPRPYRRGKIAGAF